MEHTVTVADPLDVKLDLSERESRPGEQVVLGVRVTGDPGEEVPAVLDVRGFDRAYLAAAGGGTGDGAVSPPGSASSREALRALAGTTARDAFHAFAARAEAAAKPVLEEALRRLSSGGDIRDLRMPWGTRLSAWTEEAGLHHVAGGGPITTREPSEELEFGGWPPPDPTAALRMMAPVDCIPAAHVLPPRGRAGSRRWDSIDRGFDWLPHHQSPDGSFDPVGFSRMCLPAGCGGEGDPRLAPGTTGAVVLAYLGAGETHKHGRYKGVVRAGLRFLKECQDEEGLFCGPGAGWARLNHAMATLAMCEAYGLTLSPLFKSSAQRGVTALAASQREDGAFSEAGWEEGSLILTTWAAAGLRSAQISGLTVPDDALPSIARWADRHAAPDTEIVPCSAQEIHDYPFATSRPSPGPAGMTAMIRIFSEGRRAGWHRGLDDTPGLPDIPPPTAETGLHDVWWGSMAAFRIGGKTWREFNEAMKEVLLPRMDRTGCRVGSFPPGESGIGRPAATAFGLMCVQVYYRYSAVFGGAGGPRSLGRPRSDFPDLFYSNLALPTDENGNATLALDLPDSVTTWALEVGAWDGKGRYGRAETAVKATLPLEVFFDVPQRLREGDVLALPVRVRSRGAEPETVAVSVSTSEHLEVVGKTSREVEVKAGGTATVRFSVLARKPGAASVVAVAGGMEPDAMTRDVEVLSNRYPFTLRSPLPLGVDRTLGSRVATVVDSPRAFLEVRTSPLDDAEEALKALVKRPTGCFEQTAATLYPSLLAYRYLKRVGASDPRLEARALDSLRVGYQRLLSHEVEGGGFSIWGHRPDRPDCNALAIHLLLDLSEVMEVDRGVIDRAAGRLAAVPPPERLAAERVYAAAALRRCGREASPGLAFGDDPYPVALAAVHGMLPEEAKQAALRRIEKSDWRKGGPTLFAGNYRDPVEVRAVCTHALSLLGGDPERIREELARLRSEQSPDGGWGTTRSTVAALSCLTDLVGEGSVRGELTIRRPGKPDLVLPLDLGPRGRVFDLGGWDSPPEIRADFEGTGTPFLTVILKGLSTTPPPVTGELAAEVRWPTTTVNAAIPVEVRVSLANTTRDTLHAPVISIPLPAGFQADREALDQVVRRDRFARAEIRQGRVHLYLDSLAPLARVETSLLLTPSFEGRFHAPPARAYPYYRPDSTAWTGGCTVRVRR